MFPVGGPRPAAAARAPGFRVDRKKFGFTWSCPVEAEENPISSCEAILAHLTDKFGTSEYLIAEEKHANGKKHFHACITFDEKVQTTNPLAFDVDGVHPNIIKPGKGWVVYVKKAGEFISNLKTDIFATAASKRTWAEASEFLWDAQPKFMLQYAKTAEANFRTKSARPSELIFLGPTLPFPEWNQLKALILVGSSGLGKTQAAMNFCRHNGGYFYVKGRCDRLKHYNGAPWIILDDIEPERTWQVNDWCSLLDVENGGSVHFRNAPATIPGNVGRILITNGDVEIPDDPKIYRRIFKVNF